MAFNHTPWRTPIPQLQSQYLQIVHGQAPSAVDEWDAALKRDIDALRFKCASLDSELCDVNRCLEVESAMGKRMQENERWLRQSNQALVEKVKGAEEERKKLNRTIDDLKKEIGDSKSKKSEEEIDVRVSELLPMNTVLQTEKSELVVAKVNEHQEIDDKRKEIGEAKSIKSEEGIGRVSKERVSELLWLNKTLQTEKKGLEFAVHRLEAANKANEHRRVKQKKVDMAEAKNVELSMRIQVLEKEKKSEIERLLSEKTKLESENRRLEAELKEKETEIRKVKVEKSASAERTWSAKTELAVEAMVNAQKKLAMAEAKKVEWSMKIEALEKEKKSEIERLLSEKTKLESENRRLEAEVKKKIPQLAHTIRVLKKEEVGNSAAVERNLSAKTELAMVEVQKRLTMVESQKTELSMRIEVLDKEKSTEIERILKEKTALETENRRLEERIAELVHRNGVLEKEKGAVEAAFRVSSVEKSTEIGRMLNMTIALQDQIRVLETEKGKMNTKIDKIVKETADTVIESRRSEKCLREEISQLAHNNGVLERSKRALEAQVSKAEKENDWMKNRMDNLKKPFEDEKRKLEEEKNEKISKLVKRAEVLEKSMNYASDRIVEADEALDAQKSLTEDLKNQVSENLKTIGVLKTEKEALEAKVSEVYREVSKGTQRIGVLEREREESEAKVCEANNELKTVLKEKKALEARKRDVENEGADKVSELVKRIGLLKKENRELEAKVSQAEKEKNEEIKRILDEKEALEEEKNALHDVGAKQVSELIKWIGELEDEKKEMEAKVCQAKEERSEEIQKILDEEAALEDEKRAVKEDYEKKILDLVCKNHILEREKKGFESEIMEKDEMVGGLKREKEALEATLLKIDGEKSKEIKRILNEMTVLEIDKRTRENEATQRIEALEREKNEMDTKVCQAKQEKSEEIQRILNEMKTAKEDYEKKISELVDRNDSLERENSCLEDMKKELQVEIHGLASMLLEDMQKSQLSNEAVTLSTPQQNEGQNPVGNALSSEHSGNINHNAESSDGQYEDWMARTTACKRKRSLRKWEEPSRKIPKTSCNYPSNPWDSTGLVDVKPEMNTMNRSKWDIACEWEIEQDVLASFDVHPELCLKAVCALYRQHQRLGDSTNTSVSCEPRGFKPEHVENGIILAEHLISEDPECRKMKELVATLDDYEFSECINIAKQNYKQVFEIYRRREDPVFLS